MQITPIIYGPQGHYILRKFWRAWNSLQPYNHQGVRHVLSSAIRQLSVFERILGKGIFFIVFHSRPILARLLRKLVCALRTSRGKLCTCFRSQLAVVQNWCGQIIQYIVKRYLHSFSEFGRMYDFYKVGILTHFWESNTKLLSVDMYQCRRQSLECLRQDHARSNLSVLFVVTVWATSSYCQNYWANISALCILLYIVIINES